MVPRIVVVLISFVFVTMFSFISIIHAELKCVGCKSPQLSDCIVDENCASNQKCVNYKCVNVCDNFNCSDNEDCVPTGHSAICWCETGYSRDHLNNCEKDCSTDRDCPDELYQCQTRNKLRQCIRITGESCDTQHDCPSSHICFHHRCVSACTQKECWKRNEICVARNHRATCECIDNYARTNPVNECILQCRNNYDCLPNQSCISKDSMKICVCNYGWAHDNKYRGSCHKMCILKHDCETGYWCHEQRCIKCDNVICLAIA